MEICKTWPFVAERSQQYPQFSKVFDWHQSILYDRVKLMIASLSLFLSPPPHQGSLDPSIRKNLES